MLNSVQDIILLNLSAMLRINSKFGFMQVNNNSNPALSHSLRSKPVITENDKKVQEQGGDLTTNFFFNKLKFLLKATYLTYLHWCKYAEKSTVINPKTVSKCFCGPLDIKI